MTRTFRLRVRHDVTFDATSRIVADRIASHIQIAVNEASSRRVEGARSVSVDYDLTDLTDSKPVTFRKLRPEKGVRAAANRLVDFYGSGLLAALILFGGLRGDDSFLIAFGAFLLAIWTVERTVTGVYERVRRDESRP